jgi:hypothetical protein
MITLVSDDHQKGQRSEGGRCRGNVVGREVQACIQDIPVRAVRTTQVSSHTYPLSSRGASLGLTRDSLPLPVHLLPS